MPHRVGEDDESFAPRLRRAGTPPGPRRGRPRLSPRRGSTPPRNQCAPAVGRGRPATRAHGSCPLAGIPGRNRPRRHSAVATRPTPDGGHQAHRVRDTPPPIPTAPVELCEVDSIRTVEGDDDAVRGDVVHVARLVRPDTCRGGGGDRRNRLPRGGRRFRCGLPSVGGRAGREDAQAGTGGVGRALNRGKVPVDDLCESVVHGTHSFPWGSVCCVSGWLIRTPGYFR